MTSRRDGPVGAIKKLFGSETNSFGYTLFFGWSPTETNKKLFVPVKVQSVLCKPLWGLQKIENDYTNYIVCIILHPLLHNKMEKKLNSRTEEYITKFKDDIRTKLIQLGITEKEKANELLEFVYEYDRLVFSKDDISKRKRIQNSIPTQNRCNARRADNKQCTRKRKDGYEFCGTHSKGAPYGMADDTCGECTKKLDVVAKDVNGIVYYIDKFNNVYKTEDILAGKTNPAVIAKCVVSSSGGITIPGI